MKRSYSMANRDGIFVVGIFVVLMVVCLGVCGKEATRIIRGELIHLYCISQVIS